MNDIKKRLMGVNSTYGKRGSRVLPTGRRPGAGRKLSFQASKGFNGWTVKLGCCHVIGTIQLIDSRYRFESNGKNLASESNAQIDAFLKDVNQNLVDRGLNNDV